MKLSKSKVVIQFFYKEKLASFFWIPFVRNGKPVFGNRALKLASLMLRAAMVLVVRFIMIKIAIRVIPLYTKALHSHINDHVKYLHFCYVIEWLKPENHVMNYNHISLEFECTEFEFAASFSQNTNAHRSTKIINIR